MRHVRAGRTLWGVSMVVYAFLWAPLIVIVLYSFNAARFGAGWRGFSLQGYASLLQNPAALTALRVTLIVAATSTILATVLGTLLGYGLGRFRFRSQRWIEVALQVPVLVPDIVFAVSLLLLFGLVSRWTSLLEPGLGTMVLGHTSLEIPFVALVVRARTAALEVAHEEAARDLGATPFQTFRHVTLPLLSPGILAGALLAFTLSLDDFAISFFTSGPGTTTLPVFIYASARRGITPDINALSTLLILATVVTVTFARRWNRSSNRQTG